MYPLTVNLVEILCVKESQSAIAKLAKTDRNVDIIISRQGRKKGSKSYAGP